MISKEFIRSLKNKLSDKKGKLKRLKRPPKWLDPMSAERGYTLSLYRYTLRIREVFSEILYPKIRVWLPEATIYYPDPVIPKRLDSIIDDVINDLNSTLIFIYQILKPSQDRAIESAKFFALEIAAFNKRQYEKTVNSVLGVDIFLEEPWLETQLELFANQNAQLITNMTSNEIERVSGYIQRALQEGSSYGSVVKSIEKSFGITRRHAKLIARDQTSKLNGSLTKLRQQSAGISMYRWQTSGDERVRQDHRVLDGKICRWDDPTVYYNSQTKKWVKRSTIGGTLVNPSQDVNCRCVPIPILESIFV